MTARRGDIADLPAWPLGLSLEQAAAMVGVSESHFLEHCKLIPVRIGSRKLYDRDEVTAWFKGLKGVVDATKPGKPALPPRRRSAMEMLDAAFTKERSPPQARRRLG